MGLSRRWSRLAAVLLAGSLAMTACARSDNGDTEAPGGEGPQDDHFAAGVYQKEAAGEPVRGGTLTFADFVENRTLDPSKGIATGFSGGSPWVAIYDQLVRWNVETQEWEPHLAESIEPNEDHSTWTVTLREGAEFSDGTPVDADAVVGSVNYYVAEQGYDMAVIGPLWQSIEKVDDRTVEFRLSGPWTTFPNMLGLGMGFIVAPAAIENGAEGFQPIGAGAFTLESYKPQEEMVLASNPNYWDGEPYLERLRFIWIVGDEPRVETFESGAAHVGLTNNTEVTWNLRDKDVSGALEINALNALLMINHNGDSTGSYEKARQAMGYAIDVETITERDRNGKGLPGKALFGPASRWASGVETLTYDPEKAKTLLEEAKAEGYDGEVTITGVQTSQDTILTVSANLEAVGFTVETDIMRNVADYTNKVFIERNYDVSTSGLSINEADPYQRLYSSMHSQAFTNSLGFADPDFDALIEELRTAEGEDRADVLMRVDERFQELVPAVAFSAGTNFVYWSDNVHGVFATNDSMVAFDKAWIQP